MKLETQNVNNSFPQATPAPLPKQNKSWIYCPIPELFLKGNADGTRKFFLSIWY